MATRLVDDELDVNLTSLAARLVIIIVVVVGGKLALLRTTVCRVELVSIIVGEMRVVLIVVTKLVGHWRLNG